MKYNIAYPIFFEEDIDIAVSSLRQILSGEKMLTMAENVSLLEEEFAKYVGTKFSVATNSCGCGLEVILMALGIKDKDEVIVPAQTFIATASSVVVCGARPVFAEVKEDFCVDVDDVLEKITPRTKAVIVVHFAGCIQEDIFRLKEELDKRGIYLIEDCAHAHGAYRDGFFAGNIGVAASFSFYSTKILTSGEGGIITVNDENLYKLCASIRNRGRSVDVPYELYVNIGRNSRMTEIQAVLARLQLKRLEEFVTTRNRIAKIYREVLSDLKKKGIVYFQPHTQGDFRHAYWRFVVCFRDDVDRERLREKMALRSIAIDWPYSPLVHLQPVFKNMFGIKEGYLKRTESLAKRHICLPMHVGIKEDDAIFIAEKLKESLREI